MSEEFYLSLPSHSNTDEFRNNRSNSFKIRLPRPIQLEGSGWQVGLTAISLPDININLSRYKEITEPLSRLKWYQLEDRKKDNDMGHGSANTTEVTFLDIYHYGNIRDGMIFSKPSLSTTNRKRKKRYPPIGISLQRVVMCWTPAFDGKARIWSWTIPCWFWTS